MVKYMVLSLLTGLKILTFIFVLLGYVLGVILQLLKSFLSISKIIMKYVVNPFNTNFDDMKIASKSVNINIK